MELDRLEYDVILLGTTTQQTILAAALQRAGKQVLLLDQNDFYGGPEAGFRFREFHQRFARLAGASLPDFLADDKAMGKERERYHDDDSQVVEFPEDPQARMTVYEAILRDAGLDPQEYVVIDNDSTAMRDRLTHGSPFIKNVSHTGTETITRTGSDGIHGVRLWIPPEGDPNPGQSKRATPQAACVTTGASVSDAVVTGQPEQPEQPSESSTAHYSDQITETKDDEVQPTPVLTLASLNRMSRYFEISLNPTILFSKSPLIDALVRTEMHNYFEFRAFNSTSLWLPDSKSKQERSQEKTLAEVLADELSSGRVWSTPLNRSEIFKDKELSFEEKYKLTTLLHILIHDKRQAQTTDKHVEDYAKWAPRPLFELFDELQVSPLLRSLIYHAIVFQPKSLDEAKDPSLSTITVAEASMRLRRFLVSIGRYTSGAFLYPAYGSSEITQGFARFLCIFGGACILRCPPKCIVLKQETKTEGPTVAEGAALQMYGIITSAGQLVKAPELRAELMELPTPLQVSASALYGPKHCPAPDEIARRVRISEEQGVDRMPHEDDRGPVLSLEAVGGWQAASRLGHIARAILVLDAKPFFCGQAIPTCSLITVPIRMGPHPHRVPAHVMVFDNSTCSAPQGRYVVHITALVPEGLEGEVNAEALLLPLVLALAEPGPCLQSVGKEAPCAEVAEVLTKATEKAKLKLVQELEARRQAEAESTQQQVLSDAEPKNSSKSSENPTGSEKVAFTIPPQTAKPSVAYAAFFTHSYVYSPEGAVATKYIPSASDTSNLDVKGVLAATDGLLWDISLDSSYAQAESGFREYFPGLERFNLIKAVRAGEAAPPSDLDDLWERHMRQTELHEKELVKTKHTIRDTQEQVERLRELVATRAKDASEKLNAFRAAVTAAETELQTFLDSSGPTDASAEDAAHAAYQQRAVEAYKALAANLDETKRSLRRIWRAYETLRSKRFLQRENEAKYKAAAQNTLQPVVMLAARVTSGIGFGDSDNEMEQIEASDNALIVVDETTGLVGMDALTAAFKAVCDRMRDLVEKAGIEASHQSHEDDSYMYDYYEHDSEDDELKAIDELKAHDVQITAQETVKEAEAKAEEEALAEEIAAVAAQTSDGQLVYAHKALEELDDVLTGLGELDDLEALAKELETE